MKRILVAALLVAFFRGDGIASNRNAVPTTIKAPIPFRENTIGYSIISYIFRTDFTAPPRPGSYGLFALGLSGVALVLGRRRKAA